MTCLPHSYSEEEWSVDSRYADTDAGDSTIANADTDSELSHHDLDPPAPTYTPERSTTPTLTRPGTPADFKNPRFAFVAHSRAPSGASTASIIATASSSTVTVEELPSGTKAPLPSSSSAIMIAWSAPDPATVTVEYGPTKYTLAPRTPNSMLVLPPSTDAGADSGENALYRISVNSNCFMPSSYITTIRRGGSEDGEFVGDFEIGDSMVKWTITIGEQQMLLQNIMTTKKEEAHVRASLRTNARAAPVVAQVRLIPVYFIYFVRTEDLIDIFVWLYGRFRLGIGTFVEFIFSGHTSQGQKTAIVQRYALFRFFLNPNIVFIYSSTLTLTYPPTPRSWSATTS